MNVHALLSFHLQLIMLQCRRKTQNKKFTVQFWSNNSNYCGSIALILSTASLSQLFHQPHYMYVCHTPGRKSIPTPSTEPEVVNDRIKKKLGTTIHLVSLTTSADSVRYVAPGPSVSAGRPWITPNFNLNRSRGKVISGAKASANRTIRSKLVKCFAESRIRKTRWK